MSKKLVIFFITLVSLTLFFGSFSNSAFADKITLDLGVDDIVVQILGAPPAPVRQPAEFEPMEGVLIRYSFGISYQIIAEMAEDVQVVTIVANSAQQATVQSLYQSNGVNLDHCSFLIAPTDTYWTRDYGPWFIFNGNNEQGIVDFTYNRPRPNDDQIPVVYGNNHGIPVYNMGLVHTGGNYMTDGHGISISTDLVWSENSGLTHEQIDQKMFDYLGITKYHVVPDVNGGSSIKHIDCWAKYLSPDTILIREVPQSHSQYNAIESAVDYFESQKSCYNTSYNVVRVYTPNNEPYTNSLILNNKVLVPITGSQWDDEAIASYQAAMPGYEVLGFTALPGYPWLSTDALHCRVMGITDRYMLYIEHTPLSGYVNGDDGVEIQTKIFPYSGEDIIDSNTCVYWKTDGEDWNSIQLQPLGDNLYHATIPKQENGTKIYYYIHAEDESGRSENNPYIGAPMAYSFTFLSTPNNPPDKPAKPSGPASGKVGTIYMYSSSTTDIDGDQLMYWFDWGDGTNSGWVGPYNSGATASANHKWTAKGTYNIKVKAKDVHENEGPWSDPLSVSMPRRYTFSRFLERFPRLYQMLKYFL